MCQFHTKTKISRFSVVCTNRSLCYIQPGQVINNGLHDWRQIGLHNTNRTILTIINLITSSSEYHCNKTPKQNVQLRARLPITSQITHCTSPPLISCIHCLKLSLHVVHIREEYELLLLKPFVCFEIFHWVRGESKKPICFCGIWCASKQNSIS